MVNSSFRSGTFALDSLGLCSRNRYLPADKASEIFPAIIDMRMMHPLPIYYSYCLQRGVINPEYLSEHIFDAFHCVVHGELGTARSSVAFIFYHLLMRKQEMPAYRVDCSVLDDEIFQKIFLQPGAPCSSEPSFLFFYELHLLPLELQKKLSIYLRDHSHYCIATMRTTVENHIKIGNLLPELAELFNKSSYSMPSLCGNSPEIEYVLNVLLNYYNTEYGKHIIGFAPRALETLIQYKWPGNITQAAQIMSVLVTQTKEVYISDSMVHFYLYENGSKISTQSFWLHLDLSMTLAEINQLIIECVLRQENWNQSKAAKRLGISRSTLWRMLR